MVPIFDAAGKSVIGFGGRILDDLEINKDFKAAKYLNSPESLAFKKQEVLFGQHMAKKSVRFWATKADSAVHPVVIVEGYMDVIALWQAGIREGVASMGTSLTTKQLNAAAAIAGRKNGMCDCVPVVLLNVVSPFSIRFSAGHIVLCLDNDAAGLTAVERLCSGMVLHDLTERFPINVRVASLPPGIKDPAEFIEDGAGDENIAEIFRTETIGEAIEWSNWYVERVLSSYNPASARRTPGSFGDVFERVASFLANYENAAERTKLACEVAGHLGSIIAKSDNNTQVSKTVLIQLESDLVEKAASIAHSRRAISRRHTLSSGGRSIAGKQLFGFTLDDNNLGVDDWSKLSTKALRQSGEVADRLQQTNSESTNSNSNEMVNSLSKGSRFKMRRTFSKREPDFTPHFKGFDFFSERDAKWLEMTDEKVSPHKGKFFSLLLWNTSIPHSFQGAKTESPIAEECLQ